METKKVKVFAVFDVDSYMVLCSDHMKNCRSDFPEAMNHEGVNPKCYVCGVIGEFPDY
jgi:hypothetical protein